MPHPPCRYKFQFHHFTFQNLSTINCFLNALFELSPRIHVQLSDNFILLKFVLHDFKQGWRDSMEDAHVIYKHPTEDSAMIAVLVFHFYFSDLYNQHDFNVFG